MRDRRSVDDLTIEELEQILRIKKREARQKRLESLRRIGRSRDDIPLPEEAPAPAPLAGVETAGPATTGGLAFESYHRQEIAARKARTYTLRDRLLLGVELAAALGLAVVLFFAFSNLRALNRESAAAQSEELADIPTAEPTPLIRAVVLPGGHTPPTSPGGAQPNYDEVPANLRPLVEQQFAGPVIVPTPSPANAIRIRIPAIGVDAPIVQGDGWEQLKKGVGQHIGTGNPGQPGNVVLSAHNDIYGETFRHLERLAEGDEIYLSTQTREYVYRVAYTRIVPSDEVSVMDPTTEPIVTLISCYPYLVNTERIVVVGELIER
ncbi:MAG: hypothetical protein Kow00124_07060 [Anaerolineae bacterium]